MENEKQRSRIREDAPSDVTELYGSCKPGMTPVGQRRYTSGGIQISVEVFSIGGHQYKMTKEGFREFR